MDELRESSLLFSLEGLLETERERVQREAREAQKRRDDEMIRVAELASRRRLAQEQEREARERRQALEQERDRLEEERIDAMKRATVERARIEAEGKMRLVEAEQTRKHELLLMQLREGQLTARYRSLTWLSSAALLLSLTASLVAYLGYIQPAQARERQQLRTTINTTGEQARATERALAAERAQNQTLSARVRELEGRPPAAPSPDAKPVHVGPVRPPPVTPPKPPKPPRERCKNNGDPLEKCLP
jgi:septal ring factor EnvC (AmiA/AmiB activator)